MLPIQMQQQNFWEVILEVDGQHKLKLMENSLDKMALIER